MQDEKIELPGPFDPNADKDPRFAGKKTLSGDQVDEYTSLFEKLLKSYKLHRMYFEFEGAKIPASLVYNYWCKFVHEEFIVSPVKLSELFWKALGKIK